MIAAGACRIRPYSPHNSPGYTGAAVDGSPLPVDDALAEVMHIYETVEKQVQGDAGTDSSSGGDDDGGSGSHVPWAMDEGRTAACPLETSMSPLLPANDSSAAEHMAALKQWLDDDVAAASGRRARGAGDHTAAVWHPAAVRPRPSSCACSAALPVVLKPHLVQVHLRAALCTGTPEGLRECLHRRMHRSEDGNDLQGVPRRCMAKLVDDKHLGGVTVHTLSSAWPHPNNGSVLQAPPATRGVAAARSRKLRVKRPAAAVEVEARDHSTVRHVASCRLLVKTAGAPAATCAATRSSTAATPLNLPLDCAQASEGERLTDTGRSRRGSAEQARLALAAGAATPSHSSSSAEAAAAAPTARCALRCRASEVALEDEEADDGGGGSETSGDWGGEAAAGKRARTRDTGIRMRRRKGAQAVSRYRGVTLKCALPDPSGHPA